MARFELKFKTSVAKDLRGFPKPDVRKILRRAEALRDDLRPQGCEKLAGAEVYLVRQGAYRIVYTVDDDAIVVEVVQVGHRREV
jgi:mRNA interferase RelE/StbE